MLPVEQFLRDFLVWLKHGVGPWGPLIMAAAYIPLTVLALPGSILTLGGGYVFGLTVGFIADSIGSTAGATAAFLVGKTIGRSYVTGKLRDFPQFQAIASAIAKSGFKIVLLLRLVPILPFNIMNYLLSVTPIPIWSFVLASWVGMMPITFVFVYLGTTIKDISQIGSPGETMAASQWWVLGLGLLATVVATVGISMIAKDELQKAIDEHEVNKEDDDTRGGNDEETGPFRISNSNSSMDTTTLDLRKNNNIKFEVLNVSLDSSQDGH